MAMTHIRVGLLPSTQFIAGTLPVPKIKDPETGEVATDHDTGETLHTLAVFLMEEGRAAHMKITVPESGLPGGLQPGMPVRVMELFATPWAKLRNGRLFEGVAYRAAALELVK
ncbi:SCO3933 family regulatory protein [Streptomyces malaysiensis]|uniref:Replication activator protein Pra n=1 Tax=Streptomyces malaysiensis TaxID=92644 RepID=A0A7X5X2L0_STRMQ|nr:hypothetical protein [Streptomyces malaysiensis]NIY65387.1 replication activator protein Pra [Streptomyces malaysiensis]